MVQIIKENRRPTFGERIGLNDIARNVGTGFGQGLSEAQQEKKSKQLLGAENRAAEEMGIKLTGISDPKIRQEIVKQHSKYAAQKEMINELFPGGQFGSQGKSLKGEGKTEVNPDTGEINVGIPSLIPDEQIQKMALINPAVANQMQKQNEKAIAEAHHQEKMTQRNREIAFREKKETPEHQREQAVTSAQAKADIEYNKELQASQRQHELKTQTLDKLEKLNEKGVTGKPYEKLLEKFGLVNLTSEGRREFAADVKNLITDIRSILGAQFTGFEFQTILNAYPSADFSQDANRAIINNLKEFQDIRHQEFEIAKDLKKENGGKLPADYQSLVNDRLREYANTRLPEIKANTKKIMNEEYGIEPGYTLMFDPQGEPLSVPDEMIDEYESLGATMP